MLAYLMYLRPQSWPLVTVHCLTGLVVAGTPWDAVETPLRAAALLASWVVCLNGGTLALNSAYDRDTGPVGFLRKPPPLPPRLGAFAWALMAAGAIPAGLVSPALGGLYLASVALSWAYSVPPLRLKAVAGADLAVNILGYGAMTFAAGWLAARARTGALFWILTAGFGLLFGLLYPLTQIYQMDEDRARGDRTLSVRLGRRGVLRLGAAFGSLAFVCFALAWYGYASPAAWLWYLLALAAWAAVIVPWLVYDDAYPHERGMYRAFAAWAVTSLATVLSLSA